MKLNIHRKDLNVSDCIGAYLLKGGEYWDIKKSKFIKADIIIENGIIKDIGIYETEDFNGNLMDISGKVVFPGFMDMHVHFREPGREDKETVFTGSMASAAGGFTGACPMPNTNPIIDNQELVKFIIDKGKDLITDIYPIGAISKELKGEEIAEIADMVNAGIVAVSDDGIPTMNLSMMRKEGFYSTKLGLAGMPPIAEEIAVTRNIMIAEYTGCKIHIAHVSTSGALDIIKKAKDKGVKVTCEVSPHHLTLSDKCIESLKDTTKKQ